MLTIRPVRATIHGRRSSAAVLLTVAVLVAGCAPAPTPTPSPEVSPTQGPSPTASPTVAATATSTATPGPTPSPTPKPSAPIPSPTSSPITLAGFTTPAPLSAGATWKGIDWHKLQAGDPSATVGSMVPFKGGFIATGAVVGTGDTSRTPVWVSRDGAHWNPLDPEALGPATVVLGVGETKTGVVALTLQGGKSQCDPGDRALICWTLAPPLQAWTSTDGVDWTPHAGPLGIPLANVGCDDCGLAALNLRAGAKGLLVYNPTWGAEQGGSPVALSEDGITWKRVPGSAFPTGFSFADVERSGSGFIAVGSTPGEPRRAAALTSSDGRHWVAHYLPTPVADRPLGAFVSRVAVGSKGIIAQGWTGGVPGRAIWWTSVTGGRTWLRFLGYPPVGIDKTAVDAGNKDPFGSLVADGTRIVADRGGTRTAAWSSLDGRSWRILTVGHTHHPQANGDLTLLPVGLLWTGYDGSAWLGQPVAP